MILYGFIVRYGENNRGGPGRQNERPWLLGLNKLLVKTVWRKWKTEIKQEIKLQKMEKASKGASDSVEESQSQLKGPQGHLRQRGSAAAGTASGTLEGFSCS